MRREDAARNYSSVMEILRRRKCHSTAFSECRWDAWASTPPSSRRSPQNCLLFSIPRRDFRRIRHSCATEVNPPLGQGPVTVAGSQGTTRGWLISGNSEDTIRARPALYRESCRPCLNQYVKSAAGIYKQGQSGSRGRHIEMWNWPTNTAVC